LWITFLHIVGKIHGYYWERISCWTLNCKQIVFLFYCVLFNKDPAVCDENNLSSGIWLCYKDTYYVLGFSCYSKLYNISWLWMSHIAGYWMKIGLLHLLSTFLISLFWEKQQWIESTWRIVGNLQELCYYVSQGVVICICQISLVNFLANWLSVASPFHERVIDSIVIPITNIIKCTWHEVHLHNHFSKFSST